MTWNKLISALGQVIAPSFINLSLRAKLILAFLGVTVLSIGLITLVTSQVIRDRLTEQVGTSLQALARVKAQQIAELLDRQRETLQSLTLNPVLRDAIETTNAGRSGDPAAIREQLRQLDLQWDVAADNAPLIQRVLDHPTSHNLREFQQNFPGFVEMLATNQHGELVGASQRTSHYYYADEAWWKTSYNQGQGAIYISQPEFNNKISTFGMTIAIPVRSRSGDRRVVGVLRGTYSLAALTEGLALTRFGQTGNADLLLPGDQLLVSEGILESLEPELAAQLNLLADQPYGQFTFHNTPSLVSQAPITQLEEDTEIGPIQQLNWRLVVDQEAAEALTPVNQAIQTALLASLGALFLAGVLAFVIARPLVEPVTRLTAIAKQIAGGDLKAQAPIEATDEIGALAMAFNNMTGQLRQTLVGLENRTRGLEIIANLSEHLTTILKVEELLPEVVNQIKDSFGYYHAHIYLLDQQGERLVVAEGTGAAGAEMKASGYSIALESSPDLAAQAARSGDIVRVDNVREVAGWLPNPLLPDTYAEMAIPIILEGRVIGVLEVQQDKIAGLDESDENLLRSLANQAAVGIRNARLFAEVESALAEARAVQAQYRQQAWDRQKIVRRNRGWGRYSPDRVEDLDEVALVNARQLAFGSEKPTVVTIDGNYVADVDRPERQQALVAPISLAETKIGDLQLHGFEPDRQWSEGEMALIEAVLDQVAQAAEALRLLDETQERATRERLIGQISDKFRRAPDLETLMKLGVEEIGRVLRPDRAFVRLGSEAELSQRQLAEAERLKATDKQSQADRARNGHGDKEG